MTHNDIYTKFMIEYDKANVTSSYPSLTQYEVATVLDKAYNALIAQKVTGNNLRRAQLESDIKAVADIQPLVKSLSIKLEKTDDDIVPNRIHADLDKECLYYLEGYLKHKKDYEADHGPYDGAETRMVPTILVDHITASKFFASASNMPWIKTPVSYIENDKLYVVYDLLNPPAFEEPDEEEEGGGWYSGSIVFIKKPHKFVKELDKYSSDVVNEVSYFKYESIPFKENIDTETPPYTETEEERAARKKDYYEKLAVLEEDYTFECNETMAEELISLAIAFALENVESQRLNSKLNMRGLEA